MLRRLQEAEFVEFTQLFSANEGKPVLVVTFIAILELARESLIQISQDQAYAPVYVRLRAQDITEPNAETAASTEQPPVNHESGTTE